MVIIYALFAKLSFHWNNCMLTWTLQCSIIDHLPDQAIPLAQKSASTATVAIVDGRAWPQSAPGHSRCSSMDSIVIVNSHLPTNFAYVSELKSASDPCRSEILCQILLSSSIRIASQLLAICAVVPSGNYSSPGPNTGTRRARD